MYAEQNYYYDPNVGAAGGAYNEGGDGGAVEAEEEAVSYPLPPLPEVRMPEKIGDIQCTALYETIREIRRQVDETAKEQRMRKLLMDQSELATALLQVLHESGLLIREVDDELGKKKYERVPLPTCQPPPLPPGYTWTSGPSTAQDTHLVQVAPGAVKQEVKVEQQYYNY